MQATGVLGKEEVPVVEKLQGRSVLVKEDASKRSLG